MKVTITIEDSDLEGLENGEYVIDNYHTLGIERTTCVIDGVVCQDDRSFAAVGRLVSHPDTVTFSDLV